MIKKKRFKEEKEQRNTFKNSWLDYTNVTYRLTNYAWLQSC